MIVGQGLCILDSAAESFPFPTNDHTLPRRFASTQSTVRVSARVFRASFCNLVKSKKSWSTKIPSNYGDSRDVLSSEC